MNWRIEFSLWDAVLWGAVILIVLRALHALLVYSLPDHWWLRRSLVRFYGNLGGHTSRFLAVTLLWLLISIVIVGITVVSVYLQTTWNSFPAWLLAILGATDASERYPALLPQVSLIVFFAVQVVTSVWALSYVVFRPGVPAPGQDDGQYRPFFELGIILTLFMLFLPPLLTTLILVEAAPQIRFGLTGAVALAAIMLLFVLLDRNFGTLHSITRLTPLDTTGSPS